MSKQLTPNGRHTVHIPLVYAGAKPQADNPQEPIPAGRGLAGNPWRRGIPERYHGRGHRIGWSHSWNWWHGVRDGIELIPMMWGLARYMPHGKHKNYLEEARKLNWRLEYDGWLIFVNEPTFSGQAILNPTTAAWLFKEVCELFPKAKITSPQMAIWHPERPDQLEIAQGWLGHWWYCLGYHDGLRERVAAWAWHNYFTNYDEHVYANQRWGSWVATMRPAETWVTEWNTWGPDHADGGEELVRKLAEWYDEWTDRHALYTNYVDTSTWYGSASGGAMMFEDEPSGRIRVSGIGRGWGLSEV